MSKRNGQTNQANGAPFKLTPAKIAHICAAIAGGASIAKSGASAGISEGSMHVYLRDGKDFIIEYPDGSPKNVKIKTRRGSIYYLSNGERVRGKQAADRLLSRLNRIPILMRFIEDVKKAEAQCEVRHLALINQTAAGHNVRRVTRKRLFDVQGQPTGVVEETVVEYVERSWQASAWILERKFPERWSKIESLRVSHDDEDLIVQRRREEELDGLTNEELQRIFFDEQ